LFEYFILAPTRDRAMREAMEARITAAGRQPLKPLPDAQPATEEDN
jgi:hypothetical protein